MKERLTYVPLVLLGALALAALCVWSAVLAGERSNVLTVAFLDVGQGDAIYIESPNGTQVLLDGGKGGAVLEELGRVMPFYDRSIDVVIASHPDMDHIGGLPEVFARYAIGMFLEPGVADDGADYRALLEAVRAEGLTPIHLRQGMTLAIGDGAVLEVLFPDREVSGVDSNVGSVVARLTHGDTSFLLTGDSPEEIETYLAGRYGDALKSTVLKLGHHGSRTASSEVFLGYVEPEYAVISAGCKNSYGHPHKEVLERLERFSIRKASTCEEGTVRFESDGSVLTRL